MKQKNSESPQQLAENWQRCRQEDLPKAFYAYDKTELQSERVVTYRLEGKKSIKMLLDLVDNPQNFNFIVRLGLRTRLMTDIIPSKPAFALFIEVNNIGKGPKNWSENTFELVWEKNSRFSTAESAIPTSEANAIPAAGAYLFVYSWLETPEAHLDRPFTATTRVMGERVKAYIFSPAESQSIYEDIKRSDDYCLDIHLGRGVAVWAHPFSFRPVIEVKGAIKNGFRKKNIPNATGLSNGPDEGDSFYDYGFPDPPGDPD